MPAGELTRGLEVVEFACGIPQLLKGEFSDSVAPASTAGPCGSRSGSAPASPRSTSPPWCRCGCFRSPSRAAMPSCSSPPRRIPAVPCDSRSCLPRPGCRRRVERGQRRPRGGRHTAHASGRRGRQFRRLHAGGRARLRDCVRRTASGCRRSAAPRITWWSCRTRIRARGRRAHGCGLRFRRRTLYGDLGGRCRG